MVQIHVDDGAWWQSICSGKKLKTALRVARERLGVQVLRFAKPPTIAVSDPAAAVIDVDESTTSYTLRGTSVAGASVSVSAPGADPIRTTVAQDGTWLIKKRDGDGATENISDKTPNDAVKKLDATGKSTNALEVRVRPSDIQYVVNGTVVHTTPTSGLTARTGGIYGIRVNHQLDVHVDGFGIGK